MERKHHKERRFALCTAWGNERELATSQRVRQEGVGWYFMFLSVFSRICCCSSPSKDSLAWTFLLVLRGKEMPSQQPLIAPVPFFKQNLSVTHFGRQFFLLYYLILVLSPSTFILFLLWPIVQQGRWQQNPRKLQSQGLWPLQSMAVCEAGH